MSNHHIIEQILASADIVKIIGKHVELKRSGNEFKGCCPFHGEKTPSFFVNPQKNLYNCFGCGVKGNALTFLKEYENMTAGEALRELSRQTGIELPKEPFDPKVMYQRVKPNPPALPHSQPTATLTNLVPMQSPVINDVGNFDITTDNTGNSPANDSWQAVAGEPALVDWESVVDFYNVEPLFDLPLELAEQDNGLTSLYDLLEQITLFYQTQLANNEFAKQYFIKRGLTEQTIAEFALGYAPTGWQHLEQAFPRDIEGLKILGLVRTSQKGRDFDLLRHRVIFPIRDNQGRVVGFAGRALNDDDQPKYINSSDSPVFKKQHILYGLYEGRLAKAKNWLVVEGYMDVISLHQAGVYGAVASMGTAIATPQIEKLLQLNPVLTLSFDGDKAGQQASWRAMETALPVLNDSKELRFLTLPNNHDPDSFVKAFGKDAMQHQIDSAIPLSQYLFSVLSRRHDISITEGRTKLLAEISELTRKLPKGSYGWLLREDMRSRMGLGKRAQARTAHDALLNFDSSLTPEVMLQLCFLYQPELLGGKIPLKTYDESISFTTQYLLHNAKINNALIEHIYHVSQVTTVFLPQKKRKNTPKMDKTIYPLSTLTFSHIDNQQLPYGWKLPYADNAINLITFYQQLSVFYRPKMLTWQEIVDEDTVQLIDWIQQIQPQLLEVGKDITNDFEQINAKAHFILAGLPYGLQKKLLIQWTGFFISLSQRLVTDIFVLMIEVITALMLKNLKQPKNAVTDEDFENLRLIRAQSTALHTWFQQWQQRKDD